MGIAAQYGISASGQPNAGDGANAVASGVLSAVGPSAPFSFRGPMNLELWASYNTALTTTLASLTATIGAAGALAIGSSINSANVLPGSTLKTITGTSITIAPPPLSFWSTILANGQVTIPPGTAGVFAALLLGATVALQSNVAGVTLPAGTTVTGIIQNDVAATNISAGRPAILQLSNPPTGLTPNNGTIPLVFTPTANSVVTAGADALASFTGAAIVYTGTVQLERSFDGGRTWLVCNVGSGGTLAQWNAGTPVSITFGEPEKNVLYRLNALAYTGIAGTTLNYRISQTGGAAESLAIGPLSGG